MLHTFHASPAVRQLWQELSPNAREGFNSAVIYQSDGGDNAKVGREEDDSNLCWAWRTKRNG